MFADVQPAIASKAHAFVRMAALSCDGSGIALGISAGGGVAHIDSLVMGRQIAPPLSLLEGVAINSKGERFINEDIYTGSLGRAIAAQPDGAVWLVLDRNMFWRAFRSCLNFGSGQFKYLFLPTLLNFAFGGTRRAATISELGTAIGVPPGKLKQTVEKYNADATRSAPDAFGKAEKVCVPLARPGFYAVNLSLANKFSFFQIFSVGGLTVDEASGEVTTPNKKAITGLYAAGRAAVGLCSNGYISGLSLADCVFSGRRAGRSAASRKEKEAGMRCPAEALTLHAELAEGGVVGVTAPLPG
jgi:3-oxo-5alpha-steroid 4-dehydrogenase